MSKREVEDPQDDKAQQVQWVEFPSLKEELGWEVDFPTFKEESGCGAVWKSGWIREGESGIRGLVIRWRGREEEEEGRWMQEAKRREEEEERQGDEDAGGQTW